VFIAVTAYGLLRTQAPGGGEGTAAPAAELN
jgi:hypothetical protein